MYRFEWDEAKNRANRLKHNGISFDAASGVFRDPLHISVQDRIESGEMRWQTYGLVDGARLLIVAHTRVEEDGEGGFVEVIRIVSARRMARAERRWYEEQGR